MTSEKTKDVYRTSYEKCLAIAKLRIAPLLNERKLLASEMFALAVIHASRHHDKHRDHSGILMLSELFDDRASRLFVVNWFCKRCGLRCEAEGDRMRLQKSEEEPMSELQFREDVSDFLRSQRNRPPLSSEGKKTKKAAPKRVDMLDSSARLPGSYGAGKRR